MRGGRLFLQAAGSGARRVHPIHTATSVEASGPPGLLDHNLQVSGLRRLSIWPDPTCVPAASATVSSTQ